MSTIELIDIHKTLGRTKALASATVVAKAGVTGLLGPNGAGKTTLLRIAATVLAPDSGVVRLAGYDLDTYDKRRSVRRRLGYCPQEPGFHPSFTAFEFIDYVAILKEMHDRRSRHAEVRRVVAAVGLDEVVHRRIRRLSGGMRRRVAVAQALLGEPDLLILDEPMAGLDPEQRMRFRELVSRAGERSAMLLSTHQTEDVAALCQRVSVMSAGAIVFEGTPAELATLAAGKVWRSDGADPSAPCQLAVVGRPLPPRRRLGPGRRRRGRALDRGRLPFAVRRPFRAAGGVAVIYIVLLVVRRLPARNEVDIALEALVYAAFGCAVAAVAYRWGHHASAGIAGVSAVMVGFVTSAMLPRYMGHAADVDGLAAFLGDDEDDHRRRGRNGSEGRRIYEEVGRPRSEFVSGGDRRSSLLM